MSETFLPGQKVTVVRSNHASILPGDIGIVDSPLGKGYAVTFEKVFPSATSNARSRKEIRIIYFDTDQLA